MFGLCSYNTRLRRLFNFVVRVVWPSSCRVSLMKRINSKRHLAMLLLLELLLTEYSSSRKREVYFSSKLRVEKQ